jgi:hypothetical protein
MKLSVVQKPVVAPPSVCADERIRGQTGQIPHFDEMRYLTRLTPNYFFLIRLKLLAGESA